MCYTHGFLFALHLVALVCLSSSPTVAAAAAAAAATSATATTATATTNKHQLLMHHSHSSHHNHHHNNHEQQQEERESSNKNSAVSEDVVYNYLMQFDYLPKSDLETGALRSEEQLIDAIRNLQVGGAKQKQMQMQMPLLSHAFGNIPVTGQINQATAKLIQKPRCGVGDNKYAYNFSPDNLDHGNGHGHGSRVRRYVLQGAKWDKTDLTWR
ncbi:hypothetical protein ACLKA6_000580 [Drosophila palustris]